MKKYIRIEDDPMVELLLKASNAQIHATDISPTCFADAQSNVSSELVTFTAENVMINVPAAGPVEIVKCCEVQDYIDDSQNGFEALAALNRGPYFLRREPLWRILKLARRAHIKDWVNSTCQLRHWSTRGLLKFISDRLTPISVRSPIPFSIVLCQPNGR